MLSSKDNTRIPLILLLIFSNFWIYKILNLDLLLGFIIIVCSFLICIFWKTKHFLKVSLVCVIILLIFQYLKTETQSLTILDNDQQRLQQERIHSYPPAYIDLYFKVIWLKPSIWIEQNNFIIALSRIEQNLLENLDLNKYFFGGYPRNNPNDFEKFSFVLLPLFLLGVINLLKEKKIKELLILFVIPILFITYIGSKNNLGQFSLLPFLILTFYNGTAWLRDKLKTRYFLPVLIVAILLGLLIQFSYAKI